MPSRTVPPRTCPPAASHGRARRQHQQQQVGLPHRAGVESRYFQPLTGPYIVEPARYGWWRRIVVISSRVAIETGKCLAQTVGTESLLRFPAAEILSRRGLPCTYVARKAAGLGDHMLDPGRTLRSPTPPQDRTYPAMSQCTRLRQTAEFEPNYNNVYNG